MAFDFPNTPILGQIFTIAGINYVWDGTAWSLLPGTPSTKMALSRNLVVNPACLIQQEGSILPTANGSYVIDQWHISAAGIAMQGATGAGPDSRYVMVKATTAKPSLAAGDYLLIGQPFEGQQVIGLRWGYNDGKPAVLRFTFNGQAGTYCAVLRNLGNTQTFAKLFTVPAGENDVTIRVPPPPVVTPFVTDNTLAFSLFLSLACGTTYQAPVEGWNAGNYLGCTGQSNGAVTTNYQGWGRVGLHIDPENVGMPPPWQTPDFGDELSRCQRYFEMLQFTDFMMMVRADGGAQMAAFWHFATFKRTSPTVTFTANGTGVNLYQAVAGGASFLKSDVATSFAAVTSAKAIARL